MGGTSKHSDAAAGAAASDRRVGVAGAPWGAVGPLLAALGTSAGLIGFVVFFGGGVLWTQADAEGLPANEVVALVPRTVLLSVGAHFLVAALMPALLGVGILWAYDVALRDPLLRKHHEKERSGEELRDSLEESLDAARKRLAAAADAVKLECTAHIAALQAAAAAPHREAFSDAVEDAKRRRSSAEREHEQAVADLERLERDVLVKTAELDEQCEEARKKRESRENWTRLPLLGLLFFAFLALFSKFASIGSAEYIAIVPLTAVTVAVSLVIYAETKRFLWFAISAFLVICIFRGIVTYLRTYDTPQAEPAAALVDGRAPVDGYFIAQTSDRIYLGVPQSVSPFPRMIALRRDDVVALAIGRFTRIGGNQAFHVARQLGSELCEDLSAGQSKRSETASEASRPRCPSKAATSSAARLALGRSAGAPHSAQQ